MPIRQQVKPKTEDGSPIESYSKIARDVAFVIGIYLFFTGFAYREYYLTRLAGAASAKNSLDFSETVVNAYRVFNSHWVWLVVSIVLLFMLSLLPQTFRHDIALQARRYQTVLVVAGVLGLFPLFNFWALQTADWDYRDMRLLVSTTDMPPGEIVFKHAAEKSYPPEFRDTSDDDGLYIVGGDDKVTYVLWQSRRSPDNCNDIPPGYVLSIPNDDIQFLKLYQKEMPVRPIPTPSSLSASCK
jgi:hypothetical protein